MFSPDDLTPVFVALPYVAATAKGAFRSPLAPPLAGGKPRWCAYLPWFCR